MAADRLTDLEWEVLTQAVAYYETVLEDGSADARRVQLPALNRAWAKLKLWHYGPPVLKPLSRRGGK
jgi:hypothetical protein